MRRVLLIALSLSVCTVSSVALANFVRTKQPASVVFKAVGPGGFRFEGKTGELNVTETDKSFTVVVPLKGLETGVALRDKHMKEKYLEIEKFPDATLEVDKAGLSIPAAGKTTEGEAKGMFGIHGKKKEITFKYKGSCDAANVCKLSGEGSMNMKDHDIVVPTYLGVTVKPDVAIAASFEVQQQAQQPAPPPPAPAPTPPAAPPAH